MDRNSKAEIIDRLRNSLEDVPAVVVADFQGLDVESVSDLRDRLREAEVTYQVVKNSLAKRAISGTSMENLGEFLKGNSAIAFHSEDPAAPARVLVEYCKENDKLVLKGAWLAGNLLDKAGVEALSKLPGKDELRAGFLSLLVAAPTNFVRTVVAAPTQFAQVLRAREQQLAE